MKAACAKISSWTASFRYGGFMIGVQPTLPMPPLSTIYGLISAAAGKIISPHDTFVAYSFESNGRTVDLERIVEVEPGRGGKWNVIQRELLMDAALTLYVHPNLAYNFRKPHFSLVLGRSTDLATVDSVEIVELEEVDEDTTSTFGKSLYTKPPPGYRNAILYSLPVWFSDTMPRRGIGTRPFSMITETYQGEGPGYRAGDEGITLQLFDAQSLGLSEDDSLGKIKSS